MPESKLTKSADIIPQISDWNPDDRASVRNQLNQSLQSGKLNAIQIGQASQVMQALSQLDDRDKLLGSTAGDRGFVPIAKGKASDWIKQFLPDYTPPRGENLQEQIKNSVVLGGPDIGATIDWTKRIGREAAGMPQPDMPQSTAPVGIGERGVGALSELLGGNPAAARERKRGGDIGGSFAEYATAPVLNILTAKAIGKVTGSLSNKSAMQLAEESKPEAIRGIVKELRPSVNDFRFEENLGRAVNEVSHQAAIEGNNPADPVPSVGEFKRLTDSALHRVGILRDKFVGPIEKYATIDGSRLAARIRGSLTEKDLTENPTLVDRVNRLADAYDGRYIKLDSALDILESTNQDLKKYYKKSEQGRLDVSEQQTIASQRALADGLREESYARISSLAGEGIADIQRTYGSLRATKQYLDPLEINLRRYGSRSFMEQLNPKKLMTRTGSGAAFGTLIGRPGMYSAIGAAEAIGESTSEFHSNPNKAISKAFKNISGLRSELKNPTAPNIKGLLSKGAIEGQPYGYNGPANPPIPERMTRPATPNEILDNLLNRSANPAAMPASEANIGRDIPSNAPWNPTVEDIQNRARNKPIDVPTKERGISKLQKAMEELKRKKAEEYVRDFYKSGTKIERRGKKGK